MEATVSAVEAPISESAATSRPGSPWTATLRSAGSPLSAPLTLVAGFSAEVASVTVRKLRFLSSPSHPLPLTASDPPCSLTALSPPPRFSACSVVNTADPYSSPYGSAALASTTAELVWRFSLVLDPTLDFSPRVRNHSSKTLSTTGHQVRRNKTIQTN